MKQHLVALLSALILSVSINTSYALHSDALIDWNEVITTQENPFGSFEDNLETIDDSTHPFAGVHELDANLKKRKRVDEADDGANSADEQLDPRTLFDKNKIIDVYRALADQEHGSKKVMFECICSPVKKMRIIALSGLERHFRSTTHVRFMNKQLNPSIAYDAQLYIATHKDTPFSEEAPKKTAFQIALNFVKRDRNHHPIFTFNEKKEINKAKRALEPTPFYCECNPEKPVPLLNANSIVQHITSDDHTNGIKERLPKEPRQPSESQEALSFCTEEQEIIERARSVLQNRLDYSKYECPCGSVLTVEGTYILRDHFNTKKHTTNVHNVEKELRAKGIIR